MRGEDTFEAMLFFRGNNIAFFETDNALLHIVDEKVALLEVKRGKTIDARQVRQCLDLMERFVNSKYSVVINKDVNNAFQYQSLYEVVEERSLLSKIALFWSKLGTDFKEYGTEICKKKLLVFKNMDDAISWARTIN